MTMDRAREFWLEASRRYTVCCTGSIAILWLHSEEFDSSFGVDEEEVCVEAGIRFEEDGVGFYWSFDNNHYSTDMSFGGRLPYPDSVEDPNFWEQVESVLEQAAGLAWEAGQRSCSVCGCHYHKEESACCTVEDP